MPLSSKSLTIVSKILKNFFRGKNRAKKRRRKKQAENRTENDGRIRRAKNGEEKSRRIWQKQKKRSENAAGKGRNRKRRAAFPRNARLACLRQTILFKIRAQCRPNHKRPKDFCRTAERAFRKSRIRKKTFCKKNRATYANNKKKGTRNFVRVPFWFKLF